MEQLIQDVTNKKSMACVGIVVMQIIFLLFTLVAGIQEKNILAWMLLGLMGVCVMIPPFIMSLNAARSVRNKLNAYVQRNGLNMQQLELEFQQSTKLGDLYVGPNYFFAAASGNVIAVPVGQITGMEVKKHYGKSTYYSFKVWDRNQELGTITASERENFDSAVKYTYQYNPYMKVRGVKE